MRRFFVQQPLVIGSTVTLSTEESKHAHQSLRLPPGETVLLLDGKGTEAQAKILSTAINAVVLEVLTIREHQRSVTLELLQAPLKGPKMDWLVEKLTELGISGVHLVKTQHSVASGEKLERWQRIIQAALKQSGNPLPPTLHPMQNLEGVLPAFSEHGKILLQPGAISGLHETVKSLLAQGHRRLVLAIGPEGGFSPQEEEKFLQAGFLPAALSPQVLRGETAAIAALAIAAHSIDF